MAPQSPDWVFPQKWHLELRLPVLHMSTKPRWSWAPEIWLDKMFKRPPSRHYPKGPWNRHKQKHTKWNSQALCVLGASGNILDSIRTKSFQDIYQMINFTNHSHYRPSRGVGLGFCTGKWQSYWLYKSVVRWDTLITRCENRRQVE